MATEKKLLEILIQEEAGYWKNRFDFFFEDIKMGRAGKAECQ